MRLTTPARLALAVGRMRRWHRGLLIAAGHEAGRGNVVTAAFLLALYVAG